MAHLWEDQNELLAKPSDSWQLDTEAYNKKEGDCQKMPGKKTQLKHLIGLYWMRTVLMIK